MSAPGTAQWALDGVRFRPLADAAGLDPIPNACDADWTIRAPGKPMDGLLPNETELVGQWIAIDGKVRADAVCDRIARLTGGILDVVQDHPNGGGWVRLLRDTADGRYWERYYPQSEMHGGGPPALRLVTDQELTAEYGFTV